MSSQAHFNFLNMPNLNMLNPQANQLYQVFQKLIKDATSSIHLQKLGKKQLQSIAKELNIQEKKKKEEIAQLIPETLLQYLIQTDPSRPVETLLQQMPNLRNNEHIFAILKKFQEQYINRAQQQFQPTQMQRPVQLQQIMQNPYLNYVLIPPTQQTAQQQLLTQFPPMMNMSNIGLYNPQLRQTTQQPYYMTQYSQWMENMPVPQQEIQQLLMCPCKILPNKRTATEEVKCINCDQKLHIACMKLQQSDIKMFECPICILSKIDPLNQIIKVLQKPILMNSQNTSLNIMITTEEYHQLQDRQYQLELRSIRLDAKYMNEITWPDFCEILVNQQKLTELKPLKSNSSLKKRKDEIQFIPIKTQNLTQLVQQGYNQILIKEGPMYTEPKATFKICEDGVYACAVYLTKKRPPQDLINQIKQNKDCVKVKEDCLQLIQKACVAEKTDNDVQIDKITVKVSLKCQFDYQMIQTPARGRFCTHVQCFSLENTITINAGTSRKWKCPVCKKKIFDILIDQYQFQLLEEFRNNKENIKELVFDQNGEIVQQIKEEIEESEEEQVVNKQNQQEEQIKQIQNDQMMLQKFLLFTPQAAILQMQLQKQLLMQQQQQHIMQQQKEKIENQANPQQNKTQLKQLVEQNQQTIENKQNQLLQQLQSQAISKPKHIKTKKFDAWLEEVTENANKEKDKQVENEEQQSIQQQSIQQQQSTLQQQPQLQQQTQPQQPIQPQQSVQQQQTPQQENEKQQIPKSNRLKERLVRVIKKQFSEFIRKNFNNNNQTNPENAKNQQQIHQSNTKKYIYKFSEEKNRQPIQYNKMLADQIIMANPGVVEKQTEDLNLKQLGDEQLKQLQNFLPLGLTSPQQQLQQQLLNQKSAEHALLIQKSLSSSQPIQQVKPKEKPLQKTKSPQPVSNPEDKNGRNEDNPICID